jgi:glycosyltransferase involved in cell wall biosynthesis
VSSNTRIAYLSNCFPSAGEPYVMEEIAELRGRGVCVVPCSARTADPASLEGAGKQFAAETVNLDRIRPWKLLRAVLAFAGALPQLKPFIGRLVSRGPERMAQRVRGLAHTFLGIYLAILLRERGVRHIHVHHGYFSAWIAMVAARVLDGTFSMTLHGSDLLVHATFLDTKLAQCQFCLTVSDYNRSYLLNRYPLTNPDKVVVQRLGVEIPSSGGSWTADSKRFRLLSVGRLHAVKDHTFLLRACYALKERGFPLACSIAGDGPERARIERLIGELNLKGNVTVLGHVPRQELDGYYRGADLVVLTSRSEGVPVVLMEAMARECLVLAPAITGIPELVKHGETGFLYCPRQLDSFTGIAAEIFRSLAALAPIRRNARQHVNRLFQRDKNLTAFAECFLSRLADLEKSPHAHSLLQQVQLRLQRDGSLPVRTDGPDAIAGS